jgi:hypothetical protein
MKKQRFVTFTIALLILSLLAGCSELSQQQIEAKATEFVKSNVRFFAREDNSTVGITQFKIENLKSTYSDDWDVAMHVTAISGNETKQNDIAVKLDKAGNVLELNGNPLPRSR